MKKFIDTHCHIFKEYYDDIPFLIDKISEKVGCIINNATNRDNINELLEISQNYNSMYIALGIHPEEADNYTYDDLLLIEKNIKNKKVVAIGEIGLDYHYDNYDKDKQIKLFELQLELAQKYNLPVIIHSRDATLDTINTLKKYHCKGVIHCFSGSYETALEYIKLGFFLGINGVVTFKNAKLIEVIKKIGLEHIVLETDSPYLTPVPLRGKVNNPSYIDHIIQYLSVELNISFDDIVDTTNKNVFQIFDRILSF